MGHRADVRVCWNCYRNRLGGCIVLTRDEVEMLAALLTRAGVNAYEAAWANVVLEKLRVLASLDAQKKQEDTQAPADLQAG